MTWDIDRLMRYAAFGLFCFTAGTVVDFKFYRVAGLWGTQNAALHTDRVVLPALAKTAVAASKACEVNAGVAKDNEASPQDLIHCPNATHALHLVPKQIVATLPK